MIDIDTRLRVARGIAKTETEASQAVFETLKRRGHPDAPPPTVSEGWGGIDDAMVEVYGVVPEYQGVGRPPTLKQPQPGWQYLQGVKQCENGRVVGTELRVVFGDEEEVLDLLGKSTAYVERTHQWSPGTQDTGLFQAVGDVARLRHLGRPGVQSGSTTQNITTGGQCPPSPLATTLACYGCWTI